ncbi:ABC transporter permease [Erysipelotrichaceae bacterium OttesenSCG-928-M19]|nr:ABC transporter permease [Erysipelotrichaceae bacterium OttesenSCG-928-M19]
MDSIITIIASTFMYATPIIVAAIGGLFSERSGVTNIALEGIMLIGAFVAAVLCYFLGQMNINSAFFNDSMIPWISALAGGIAGLIFSILHAIASIKYKADQIISGTALNMLALGLTVFVSQVMFQSQRTPAFNNGFKGINIGFLNDIPILGNLLIQTYSPFIFSLVLVVVTWFIVKKTRFGLRLRACGEYPQAAASMGINVYKTRYIAVIISGLLGGIAGGFMMLTVDQEFSASVIHGFGFIAIATLIFGKWNAWGVLFAGLFFGFSNVIATTSGSIAIFKDIPNDFFFMLPYILTILALVITSGKSSGPKAVGEIYDEEKR